MKKRQFYTIGAIFLLFALATGLEFIFNKKTNLKSYVERIEQHLHKQEKLLTNILVKEDFIERQYQGIDKLSLDQQHQDIEQLTLLASQSYNICLYENDSLVYWTNNSAFLSSRQLEELAKESGITKLIQLSNGYYELIKKSYNFDPQRQQYAIGLIPVRNAYPLQSAYLLNHFITERFSVPQGVNLSTKKTDYAIQTSSGEILGWLNDSGNFKDKFQLKLLLLIYLLAFIALSVLINDAAIFLVKKYQPWVGAAFLIAMIFGIRYLTVHLELTNNFSDLPTFSKTFNTPVLNSTSSLGDLLINIVLLLWMMVFFHREFQVKKFENVSLPIKYGLTGLNYFSVILGILMISGIFKSLVLDSQITFDFDNVFNLDFLSFLSIIGILLLIIALFLFSHRMMLTIMKIGLNKYQRLLTCAVALGVAIPVILVTDLMVAIPHFLLFSIVFIGLFDLFIDNKNPSLTWLVIWLVVFAAFSSILLFKYNADKDFRLKEKYAIELANFRDSLAEDGLEKLRLTLMESPNIKSLLPIDSKNKKQVFKNLIDNYCTDNKYLFHNYAHGINVFDSHTGLPLFEGAGDSLQFHQERFIGALQTAHNGLKFWEGNGMDYAYLLRLDLKGDDAPMLFLSFKRKLSNPSKVYTELLLDQQFKDLQNLDQYDYAIYKNGILIDNKGGNFDENLVETLPPLGQSDRLKNTSKRSELIYHAPENIVVKIGKDMGTYLKPISLFSYLFGLLILTVIILAIINSFTKALPDALSFSISSKPSLRNRIQFAVITLILISFLMIGLVTVWHFKRSSDEYHQGRLNRKVDAAEINASIEIEQQYKRGIREFNLKQLIEPLTKIHRLDINLYDLQGNLLGSSEADIFKKGIIAPKMGAIAFQNLSKIGKTREVQKQTIGGLHYQSAYIPLKSPTGAKLAYLGVPYYSEKRESRSDVSEFMGTLLNVYVFLLLIAGAIAIAVANSITKPISDLGDSLKRLKLGKNEPLVWKSKDELGELIREYNQMIRKLEDSTEMLAQSEREGAWREMAKQVAHEIKNPLTPMKLSIQYLLHAYTSNPDNIKPLLQRVSKTLIEQIDSLSQIASEFSNFAKMPQADNTKFLLNDVATSVHGLFANERQDMDISLYVPDKEFFVYADKNHLTRVLNNLIKNAIQAIPDDRTGIIDVRILQDREKVVIKVSDNGVGISDEMREKVFVPNFTTKNSGTGLGLAISKNIMESFNGKIYFETKVNIGTDFYIELPLIETKKMQEV